MRSLLPVQLVQLFHQLRLHRLAQPLLHLHRLAQLLLHPHRLAQLLLHPHRLAQLSRHPLLLRLVTQPIQLVKERAKARVSQRRL
jgi:hypothetical protein